MLSPKQAIRRLLAVNVLSILLSCLFLYLLQNHPSYVNLFCTAWIMGWTMWYLYKLVMLWHAFFAPLWMFPKRRRAAVALARFSIAMECAFGE